MNHTVTPNRPDRDGNILHTCACGWCTIEDPTHPAHHTPLDQRIAEHLQEADDIESGAVWKQIPPGVTQFEVVMRRKASGFGDDIAINAVWLGGFRTVRILPWGQDYAKTVAYVAQEWEKFGRRLYWAHNGFPADIPDARR